MLFVTADRGGIGAVLAGSGVNINNESLLFQAGKMAWNLAFGCDFAYDSCAVCQSGIDGVLCSNQHRVLFYTFGAG